MQGMCAGDVVAGVVGEGAGVISRLSQKKRVSIAFALLPRFSLLNFCPPPVLSLPFLLHSQLPPYLRPGLLLGPRLFSLCPHLHSHPTPYLRPCLCPAPSFTSTHWPSLDSQANALLFRLLPPAPSSLRPATDRSLCARERDPISLETFRFLSGPPTVHLSSFPPPSLLLLPPPAPMRHSSKSRCRPCRRCYSTTSILALLFTQLIAEPQQASEFAAPFSRLQLTRKRPELIAPAGQQ